MPKAGDIESVYVGETPDNVGEKFAVFAISDEKIGQGHGRRLISRHYTREDAERFQDALNEAFKFFLKA